MKKILVLVLILCLLPSLVIAQLQQTGTQIQDRDRIQSNINEEDQLLAREEIHNRLHINYQAYLQMKEMEEKSLEYQFRDLENHWAKNEVKLGLIWGLVKGYPDGLFRPDNPITGTEGVLLLSRMMNCITNMEAELNQSGTIDWDLVPIWAREQLGEEIPQRIALLSQNYGIDQLTRIQFSLMLAKALGIESTSIPEGVIVFLDDHSMSKEQLGYIYTLRTLGILQGNMGEFMPFNRLTRGEAVAMMSRVMNMLGKTPDDYSFTKNELVVSLQENPSTGYSWHYSFKNGDILKLVEDEYIPVSNENIVGSGGKHNWTFQPIKEGSELLTFSYYRSWEGSSTAIEERVLNVEVDKELSIIVVK